MSYPTFAPGDTRQFTWVSSVAPDSAPTFLVSHVNCSTIQASGGLLSGVMASISALQSDSTHYYALLTMPTSEGHFHGQFVARKTVSGSVYIKIDSVSWEVQKQNLPTG